MSETTERKGHILVERPETEVYINAGGSISIRQTDGYEQGEQIVVMPVDSLNVFIKTLRETAREVSGC